MTSEQKISRMYRHFGKSGSGKKCKDCSNLIKVERGNPSCNQGGIVVLAAIEGNGSRPSHKGIGINDGKVMYTLNGTEVHGVVCSNGNKD